MSIIVGKRNAESIRKGFRQAGVKFSSRQVGPSKWDFIVVSKRKR